MLCFLKNDTDEDFTRILEEVRDEKGCATFETFSTDGPSEFLVGTSTKGGGTHPGDKIRLLLQVKDSGKRVWKSRELDGARWKERSWGQWRITWKIASEQKMTLGPWSA